MLYEMLTGTSPFEGKSVAETMRRHLDAPVPSVRTHAPNISPALDDVVKHCLAKAPEDHPADVRALIEELTLARRGGREAAKAHTPRTSRATPDSPREARREPGVPVPRPGPGQVTAGPAVVSRRPTLKVVGLSVAAAGFALVALVDIHRMQVPAGFRATASAGTPPRAATPTATPAEALTRALGEEGLQLGSRRLADANPRCYALDGRGDLVAVFATRPAHVSVWEVRTGRRVALLSPRRDGIRAMAWRPPSASSARPRTASDTAERVFPAGLGAAAVRGVRGRFSSSSHGCLSPAEECSPLDIRRSILPSSSKEMERMMSFEQAALHHEKGALWRLWTEQLYREHREVCRYYRVRMPEPVICIQPLARRWATWDPLTRTITLSPALIEKYSWDVVIEVLKHEMAHQLVSESYVATRPHGVDFAEACRRLRVADWATRASGDPIDVPITQSTRSLGPEEERLLRRVEKLLALAGSTNEHEALLAMQRVQEIHARHDIDRLKARREADFQVHTIHLRKQRVDRLTSMTFSILAEHFFVRVIYTDSFDATDLSTYRSVELIGTRPNVAMAEFVYRFLGERLETLWAEYSQVSGAPGRARRDYMLGLLAGFRDKLAEGKEQMLTRVSGDLALSDTKALIALGTGEVDQYVKHRFPRLSQRRWSSEYTDEDSFEAGVEEGRRIVLRRPVSSSSSTGGCLPPATQ